MSVTRCNATPLALCSIKIRNKEWQSSCHIFGTFFFSFLLGGGVWWVMKNGFDSEAARDEIPLYHSFHSLK